MYARIRTGYWVGGVGARPDTDMNFRWGAFSFYLVGRFENGPKMVRNLQKRVDSAPLAHPCNRPQAGVGGGWRERM